MTLNPKITLIIEQFFPQIIDHHIRTRSSFESAVEGLERYRNLGYQALRKFPPDQIEENKQALDEAFADSVRRLEEFHGHGKAGTRSSVRSDISDSS